MKDGFSTGSFHRFEYMGLLPRPHIDFLTVLTLWKKVLVDRWFLHSIPSHGRVNVTFPTIPCRGFRTLPALWCKMLRERWFPKGHLDRGEYMAPRKMVSPLLTLEKGDVTWKMFSPHGVVSPSWVCGSYRVRPHTFSNSCWSSKILVQNAFSTVSLRRIECVWLATSPRI